MMMAGRGTAGGGVVRLMGAEDERGELTQLWSTRLMGAEDERGELSRPVLLGT